MEGAVIVDIVAWSPTEGRWISLANSAGANLPSTPDGTEGRIRITFGSSTTEIEDVLETTGLDLCAGSPTQLLAKQHVVVRAESYYGYIRLDLEDSLTRVSGDGLPDALIPTELLIGELLDAGDRLVTFLSVIHGPDSLWEPELMAARTAITEARARIGTAED